MLDNTVAVIGGTGHLGAALAARWAKAGLKVVIGSRNEERAHETAAKVGHGARGASNEEAAVAADLIVVAVPFAAQASTLSEIAIAARGKVLVDTTVPLVPPKVARVQMPPEGCAAARAQSVLGDTVKVISAFHNVAAHKLALGGDVDCDVLVFGDDKQAREVGVGLAVAAGLRGVHGGPLANSAAAEALTSVLIFLNRTYGVDGAGVRFTGVGLPPTP